MISAFCGQKYYIIGLLQAWVYRLGISTCRLNGEIQCLCVAHHLTVLTLNSKQTFDYTLILIWLQF